MAEVTANQASALSTSFDKADGRLQEAEEFANKVRQMQAKYMKELEQSNGRTFSILNQLSTTLKMLWDDIMHVSQTTNEAQSELDALKQSLHHANNDLDQTRENMRTAHSDAIEKTTEIAAVSVRGHEASLERALSLRRELENAGLDIGSWTANLSLVNAELERLYETSQRTHEQQEANLETQQRLGEQLRDIKESVETQKSAIEDVTTKFQTLATAGGFADLVRTWAGLAVMTLVISMVSKELARLLVIVAGLTWAILNTFLSLHVYEGLHDCVGHVIASLSSFGQSPVYLMIRLSAFLFVAIGFVLSAHRYPHRSALIETDEGTLPMIEALQTTNEAGKRNRPHPATSHSTAGPSDANLSNNN
ncbi:hypothetical protein H2201_008571 [Coniosporium apollinis]|uniref:Uncharacterized protein n=1 Tax=Coniosporium apollinis TaxID=61459 RepID=A0ABQ9NK38_9PEZI|nr:hypothetical protein H2201_008571 [Coniosporium apollinis]